MEKLTDGQITAVLNSSLLGWQVSERGMLHKTFKFASFAQALGWMVTVGVIADKMNHHPEWSNIYNRVTVDLATHDAGGVITSADVALAQRMEALAQQMQVLAPHMEALRP